MHLALSQTAGASLIHGQECVFRCFRLAVWLFGGVREKCLLLLLKTRPYHDSLTDWVTSYAYMQAEDKNKDAVIG